MHVPRSLRARLESLAQEEGVSVEQLIASALTEKVAVLDAEAYFHERVQRADRTTYDAMLDNAPDVEAQPRVAVQDVLRLRRSEVAPSRADKNRAEKQAASSTAVASSRAVPVQEQSSKFDDAMAAYRAAMEQIG
ncbi:MAG: hypothetical protein AAFV01_14395, partial [Bacteroidota bacterium]